LPFPPNLMGRHPFELCLVTFYTRRFLDVFFSFFFGISFRAIFLFSWSRIETVFSEVFALPPRPSRTKTPLASLSPPHRRLPSLPFTQQVACSSDLVEAKQFTFEDLGVRLPPSPYFSFFPRKISFFNITTAFSRPVCLHGSMVSVL